MRYRRVFPIDHANISIISRSRSSALAMGADFWVPFHGETSSNAMSEITRTLEAVKNGDREAAEKLLPLTYQELRRIAGHMMAGEREGHTLQPTALIHEAYLRLAGPEMGIAERTSSPPQRRRCAGSSSTTHGASWR